MAKIEWITKEEIEEKKNQPTEFEKLQKENEMLAMAIMELSQATLMGGK